MWKKTEQMMLIQFQKVESKQEEPPTLTKQSETFASWSKSKGEA